MRSTLPIFGSLVLFLVIGILIILPLVLILGRRSKVTTPSCGKCGYAVAGLEVLRCPECGSDLRQVGIITARMQRGLHPLARAALLAFGWTILLPIPAILITATAFDAIPRTRTHTLNATLTGPASQLYQQVTIDVTGQIEANNFSGSAIPYQTATVTLTTSAGTVRPEFDLQSLDVDKAASDLLAWMDRLHLDVDDPALIAEANELAAQLQRFASGQNGVSVRHFQSISAGSSSFYDPISPWYPIAAAAFWVIIWLAPIALITRRAVRRHRADQATATSS